MGTRSSKQSCSLKDRPQTWSLRYLPDDMIDQFAEIIAIKALADNQIITEMQSLLGLCLTQANNQEVEHSQVAKELLQKMRNKAVCHETWCNYHIDHFWRENGPRCYTIGGLELFFKKKGLMNAVQLFDTNLERIEKNYYSKQYPNLVVHGWSAFCNFVQRCHQRNSVKNLHVISDWNSLDSTNTGIVVMLLKQTEFVTTPFVIPCCPINGDWRGWRNFVKCQLESMAPGAVLIMGYSKMLLDAAEQASADSNPHLDTMEIESKSDALKFIWLCALRYRITLIGVRRERGDLFCYDGDEGFMGQAGEVDDEEDDQNEENYEETQEELEERIAKVFSLGCYRLPGEESNFAEFLLMCAYLAKNQPSSWSRPMRQIA